MHQLHTSGHASIADIIKLITKLDPKKVVPIHTMVPDAFAAIADQVVLIEDDKMFNV